MWLPIHYLTKEKIRKIKFLYLDIFLFLYRTLLEKEINAV